MEGKTEIKKIVLQLGKKEVELTVDECKKLKDLLAEMFGREIVKEIHHQDLYRWYWNYPVIYQANQSTGSPIPNQIYCSSAKMEFKGTTLNCSL